MNFILWTVQSLLKVYLALYFVFHALVFFNPGFVKYMVFMNNVKLPFQNYQNPTEYGLNNVHNFYFNSEPNVKIGVWHYVPEKLGYKFNERKDKSTKEHLSKFLKEPSTAAAPTVVIYAHGNDQDRASRFRRELCSNLVKMGYHVFALDYRGYGDSTGEPTETGVVKDLVELFELIRANAPNSRVFLYGHSLGSGVVSHAAKVLTDKKAKIDGVILEAPFLNASMASKDYILSLAFNNNKWIQGKTDEGLLQEKIFFNNDKHILEINSRMLIFHAEDDWFVPHYHGAKLKDISHNRPKHLPAVEFIPFEKAHGLGHFLQTHKPMYSRIKQLIDE